jgi:hypothetical protein
MSERAGMAYLYWPLAALTIYTMGALDGMLAWMGLS